MTHDAIDSLSIRFSATASPFGESKNLQEIEGSIECLMEDSETETEIGVISLVQINLSRATDEEDDWRDLIDSVDDDFLDVCLPLINTNCRADFSEEFDEFLDNHDEVEPSTLVVVSKVGIYKEHRGNNLLGYILDSIKCLNPDAPIVAQPFPLQYNGIEENLKIMGIKAEKKATKQNRAKDKKRLIAHYESHGFKKLGKSDTWILLNRNFKRKQ